MRLGRLQWAAMPRPGRAVVALAVVVPALAGCSVAGAQPSSVDRVAALRIPAPVHHPVWSDNAHVLLALTERSPRIAKIDPAGGHRSSAARTALSEPFRDVGENIATSPTGHNVVFLPQPRLDRVTTVGIEGLQRVGAFRAGPSPSFVSKDSGSRFLLAMSAGGSTVTAVDLQDNKVLPPRPVRAGPEAEVDGGKRGRLIDYHVAGPGGVALYKGRPLSVAKKGAIDLRAETSTGDLVKPTRAYVAQKGTDRLFAVDLKRSRHGLTVVAEAGLGESVHYLGVDEIRIYAATERKLVVLETNSFEGYENNRFPIVDIVHYRSALRSEALQQAPLSGLAVGSDRVYLTLASVPYVVSVAKPSL